MRLVQASQGKRQEERGSGRTTKNGRSDSCSAVGKCRNGRKRLFLAGCLARKTHFVHKVPTVTSYKTQINTTAYSMIGRVRGKRRSRLGIIQISLWKPACTCKKTPRRPHLGHHKRKGASTQIQRKTHTPRSYHTDLYTLSTVTFGGVCFPLELVCYSTYS
jgi:hypothetical protein